MTDHDVPARWTIQHFSTWVTKDLRPRIDLEDKDAIWSILDGR